MLNADELERYARHIVLQEVGGPGQAALGKARVLVIGAGGLGAPVILYLAAAGVGTLGVIDDDVVSLSNLQRQVIHATPDVGKPKVDAEQLIILRLVTGLGAGGAVSAAFPIAAELMPAQHRRTYGAVYEMSLATSFTLVPFLAFLLAGDPNAFRLLALPGGLSVSVVPVLVWFVLPESPRWHLGRGRPQVAVDIVNGIIRRCGDPVLPLSLQDLGGHLTGVREKLPPYWALFARGQIRWTVVGILAGVCAGTAYFLISVLLPKALVDQGSAVSLSFGLSSLVFFASIPGKAFTGFLMEVIGRRWTIAYALAGSLPGIFLMLVAHLAGNYATVVMVTGALITGFTVLSAFTATRVYLSEQFPTALRGRGHIFGESFGRLFAGVLAPFLMEPYTASPTIFFGTIFVVVAVGALIPRVFGRETVGQLETVSEQTAESRLAA